MTNVRIEAPDVAAFAAAIRAVRWDPAFQRAYDDSGERIVEKAQAKASGVGGAAPLTAATLVAESAFNRLKVTAEAPYAAGAEHGSDGTSPNTRQFSNRPGPNRSDGYWFKPALEESEGEILRRFGTAVDEAVRPVFGS